MAVQGHHLGAQFPSDGVHFLAVVVKRVLVEIAGDGFVGFYATLLLSSNQRNALE